MKTDNLLKQTKSYCPECMSEIEAKVFAEDNKAVMKKECPVHGRFEAVLENDVKFYQKISKQKQSEETKRIALEIPITYKCNSNCKFCYLPYVKDYELTDEKIKSYIDNPNYSFIIFSGGEPTLHPKLFEFICYAKAKRKTTVLITNAINLASHSYVKKLKDSGLDIITFSLNGFNDKVFQYIDGQPLLAAKLKALQNVKKAKIKTILSFSWLKDLNDNDFKKVFKLALKNNRFVIELRCRAYSSFGRHQKTKDITLSDFIKLLAEVTKIPVEEYINHWLKSDFPSNINLFRIEYFNFILNRKIAKKLKSSILTYPFYLIYLIKHLGPVNFFRLATNKIMKNKKSPSFAIRIDIWPDSNRVDLNNIRFSQLDHVAMDGSINSFFETMLLNEKIRKNKVK